MSSGSSCSDSCSDLVVSEDLVVSGDEAAVEVESDEAVESRDDVDVEDEGGEDVCADTVTEIRQNIPAASHTNNSRVFASSILAKLKTFMMVPPHKGILCDISPQ